MSPLPEPDVSPSDSIGQWVERFQRPLIAYATRMLDGDHDAAQDAVQETFLRLCRTDRQKIETRIAAWLFSVCRSRVIDMRRKMRATPIDPIDCEVADHSPSPAQAVMDAEDGETLSHRIESLSPRQREVLRLRVTGNLSYREIAEVTGLSVTNVGFHLHAALQSLRNQSGISPTHQPCTP
jgi:RNA polymerase sigma-70 factor, ECF subfamily